MNVTPNDITHTNPSPIRLLKTESDSNTINKRIRINTDEEGEGQAGGRMRRESKRKRQRYQVKTKFCSVLSFSPYAGRGWMKCYIQLYDEGTGGKREGGRERERDRETKKGWFLLIPALLH